MAAFALSFMGSLFFLIGKLFFGELFVKLVV
jgi:hypothetical protein